MRILYCIASFSSKGGTEKVLSTKASYLAENGHNVHILISDQHQKPFAYSVSGKVNIIDLNITSHLSTKIKGLSFLNNILSLRKIYAQKIEEINPDIIIVLERGYEDFVIPYINKNIPKIREFHTSRMAGKFFESTLDVKNRIKSKFIRKIYERQYKKYDAFVILTEKDKESWSHFDNVKVIPNIVEMIDKSLLISLSERPNRLIAVGSMFADRKGFSAMIDIWSQLSDEFSDWSLHIYGDGPYKTTYHHQIEKLNLQNSVFLEGVTDNIQEKYRASQIFLMTSKGEGLPMVIIEAQQNHF